MQRGGVLARLVSVQQPAGRHAIAPARFVAQCDDAAPADLASGLIDHRGLVQLTDRGQVPTLLGHREHLLEDLLRMRCLGERHERNLADAGRDLAVVRRGPERIASAEGGAERRHLACIDVRKRTGVCERRAPVVELHPRIEVILVALAVTETAMVEEKRIEAGGREAIGERPESVASRTGHAVRHHDDRPRTLIGRRGIKPGRAGGAAGTKGDVFAMHRHGGSSIIRLGTALCRVMRETTPRNLLSNRVVFWHGCHGG